MPVPRDADVIELDARARAVRRLRKQHDFRRHLTAYVLVNGIIIAVWAVVAVASGFWFPWFIFPLLGWGIGIVFHAMDAYGSDITEADIAREMEREQGRRAS